MYSKTIVGGNISEKNVNKRGALFTVEGCKRVLKSQMPNIIQYCISEYNMA